MFETTGMAKDMTKKFTPELSSGCPSLPRAPCENYQGILPYRLTQLLEWLVTLEGKTKREGGRRRMDLLPNAFGEPLETMVSQGMSKLKEHFEEKYAKPSSVERVFVKVVIVGGAGSGKTR